LPYVCNRVANSEKYSFEKIIIKLEIKRLNIKWLPLSLSLMSPLVLAQGEAIYLDAMSCMIEPSMRVDVSSAVPGVIDKLTLKVGDNVKEGAKLFSLRSGVEAASVEMSKVRVEFAKRQMLRNDEMFKENLISSHERDEFETEYQLALKELKYTKEVRDLRIITSSINGVIIDRFMDPGEFVEDKPVLSLANIELLKIELVLPYESFGTISKDSVLTIYPESPVNGHYEASISMIDPIIDAASGTYRIRAALVNKDMKIPAGIKCRASL
jgi:membrane fusion protein (multidrug efflux system)